MVLLSKVAKRRKIRILRSRGRPGHGKRGVDGTHAVVKRRLREIMRFLQEPGEDQKPRIEQEAYAESRRALQSKVFAHSCFGLAKDQLVSFRESSKHGKRERDAKTKERDFEYYDKEDVKPWRNGVAKAFKTVDPSTRDERKSDAPYRGFKGYFGLACDCDLPEGEAKLRRWPCECPPCERQAKKPKLEDRYAHNPDCWLEPMAQGLNDWVHIKPVPKEDGGDDGDESDAISDDGSDGGEEDEGYMLLQEASAHLTSGLDQGDYVLSDANRDPSSAGYYVTELDCAPFDLQEDLTTEDNPHFRATIEAGKRVIKGEYLFLVFAPNAARRWYHRRAGARCQVTLPVDLVVHAGFSMEKASLEKKPKNGSKEAQGLALGAVVLAEEDHEEARQELATRAADA